MHVNCARYAISVCPYLASAEYTGRRTRPGVLTVASRERPARMALYITRGFAPQPDSNVPMAVAEAPKFLEWF